MSSAHGAVGAGAIAAALVAGPALAGMALGTVARHLARAPVRGPVARGLMLAVPVAIACLLPVSSTPLGFWDRAFVAVMLGAGCVLGAGAPCRRLLSREAAMLVASSLVSLAALELAVRIFLPPPPSFPPAHLVPSAEGGPQSERLAAALFPAGVTWAGSDNPLDPADVALALAAGLEAGLPGAMVPPTPAVSATLQALFLLPLDGHVTLRGILRRAGSTGELEEAVATAGVAPHRVLHVGDSMLTASLDGPTFLELADAAPGPVAHVNAAVAGVGPDVYYQAVRQWLPRLHPDLVMVWIYAGNDLIEIDRPYELCNDGPLLDYAANPPRVRCEHAVRGPPPTSPRPPSLAPFPLRAATGYSLLARHLCAWFDGSGGAAATPERDLSLKEEHLQRIVTALRDLVLSSGARAILVVLPSTGQVLGNASPAELDVDRRTVQALSRVGQPWLDPLAALQEGLARLGPDGLYQPDRVHFTGAGHQVVAAWLQASLQAIGYPSTDAPAPAPAD